MVRLQVDGVKEQSVDCERMLVPDYGKKGILNIVLEFGEMRTVYGTEEPATWVRAHHHMACKSWRAFFASALVI